MSSTPDLMGELARAVRYTKKELADLDDLSEQVQSAAAKVLANPSSETARKELRDRADKLARFQFGTGRHTGIAMRARALGAYRELEESTA